MAGRDVVPRPAEVSAGDQPSKKPAGFQPVAAVGPLDEVLVDRAQQGDRAAFRQLIERHQRRIYQLALGIVKSHEEAMDIVQDTFVKVHQHLPAFKGDAAFSTWTYRIAYNLSIDSLRKTNRGEKVAIEETTLTDEGTHYEPYATESASPQKALLRGELSSRMKQALDQLSENHRAILVLREVDGLSYEELSDVLKVPKGTVMSRLFHARHKMQEALKDYLNDESSTSTPPALGTGGTGT